MLSPAVRAAVVALCIDASGGWALAELAAAARRRWARRLRPLRLLLPTAWAGLAFALARHAALGGD